MLAENGKSKAKIVAEDSGISNGKGENNGTGGADKERRVVRAQIVAVSDSKVGNDWIQTAQGSHVQVNEAMSGPENQTHAQSSSPLTPQKIHGWASRSTDLISTINTPRPNN
nr:hypothetical protein CFP56_01502 [Quercus suber]